MKRRIEPQHTRKEACGVGAMSSGAAVGFFCYYYHLFS
jgi:hypothetical protein